MNDFLLLSWLAGLGIAAVSGPLGCFVVWRRMAYFGDTMAHGALLGVALGLMLHVNLTLGVVVTSSVIALVLLLLQRRQAIASDTLLGILSHGTLSLGLVVLGFMNEVRVDLMGYLFGDILAVSWTDILGIGLGGTVVLVILARLWNALLLMTIHEDLARAEGVPVDRIHLIFMMLIALVIAMTMKIVGVLLVTSMLIIPAAAARNLARSPEAMAVIGAVIGMLAVSMGLVGSNYWDTPTGPSIVVAAMLMFALSVLVPQKKWQ
ncbi:MAG: zinc ABC transporter permease subunit ZnuB [Magnetococcales bacterium]|nr:zinc ABC transporter permease subunit ZnuB [Magnetococcales bacterium]